MQSMMTSRFGVRSFLSHRNDVVRAAWAHGGHLPDEQRAALAVEIIRLIRNPDAFATVNEASRMIGDHGSALLADALRDPPFEQAATATLTVVAAPVAEAPPGRPDRVTPPPLGAIWARIRHAEARLSSSILGDVLALICLLAIIAAAPFFFAVLV